LYIELNDTQDKRDLYSFLKKMRYPFYVAVGSVFQKRSLKQNKYYWKYIITAFAKATGQTRKKAEEELLKECALIEKYRDEGGDMVYIVERTSDMETMRMENYMSDCRDYVYDQYGSYLLAPRESISETLDLHGNTKRIIEKKESEYRP
jgi:hypothetical protein